MITRLRTLFVPLCLLGSGILSAAELGVGATREEVVALLGAPKSKLAAEDREIFSYPQGRVIMADGKVLSVEWKGAATPTPVAVGAPSAKDTAPKTISPEASVTPALPATPPSAILRDVWFTDFVAAQTAAAASHRRLLVLFTGTDWCPACVEFEATVAHADDFLNVTRPAFVLVKLDFLRNTPQPTAIKIRNEELRERYAVSSYPSLLVISADGAKSSRVDTMKRRRADDTVDYYVQAVDEARRAKKKSSLWPW